MCVREFSSQWRKLKYQRLYYHVLILCHGSFSLQKHLANLLLPSFMVVNSTSYPAIRYPATSLAIYLFSPVVIATTHPQGFLPMYAGSSSVSLFSVMISPLTLPIPPRFSSSGYGTAF